MSIKRDQSPSPATDEIDRVHSDQDSAEFSSELERPSVEEPESFQEYLPIFLKEVRAYVGQAHTENRVSALRKVFNSLLFTDVLLFETRGQDISKYSIQEISEIFSACEDVVEVYADKFDEEFIERVITFLEQLTRSNYLLEVRLESLESRLGGMAANDPSPEVADDQNVDDLFTVEEMRALLRLHARDCTLFYKGPNDSHRMDYSGEDIINLFGLEVFNAIPEEEIKDAFRINADILHAYITQRQIERADKRVYEKYQDERIRRPLGVGETKILARISRDRFGVFARTGRLESVFTDKEEMLRLLSEEDALFEGGTGRTREEQNEIIRDVESISDLRTRASIESDFGISLADLTLREQVWFVSILRKTTPEQTDAIMRLTKKFGIDAARSYLSLEEGDEFLDVIMRVGEHLSEETARQVFQRYAEFAEWAQATAEEMARAFFKGQQRKVFDVQAVSSRLLTRARQLLIDAGNADRPEDVLAQMELAKADAVLFASMFRQMFKGKETRVAFDELRGVDLQSREPKSFSNEEREAMLKMFDQNWVDQDPVAAQSFRQMLETKSAPKNEDSHFYVMKKDGQVIAFMRFDHRDDLAPGAYYAGSLNMRPDLRGSAIGETFMQQTVQKEAENHVIFAHVVPDAVVGTRYVEDGFVITGVDTIEVNGQKTEELAIRYDKTNNIHFAAKQEGVSPAHLLAGTEGVEVIHFDYAKEKLAFLETIRERAKRGEVVTRYWIDPVDSTMRFLAFERMEEPA